MVAATACKCEGEGLSTAIVRQANTFQIVVREEEGAEKPAVADVLSQLAVSITGLGNRVRAKTADSGDGSCTVSYTPETSGEYRIDVTINGEKLAGSPFTCIASTRTPHPANCSIVGDALKRAVSREQQHVEVCFRDALGNIAHAEDVDCYAEPVDELSSIAAEEELGLPDWLKAGQPASPRARSPRPEQDVGNAAKASVTLVVRAAESTDSERVCQLQRGRLLYILEEKPQDDTGGSVRALIAVEDEDAFGEEQGWRTTYAVSSPPLRGGRTSSPRSPRRAPVGWVTIQKDGKALIIPQRQLAAAERQQHMAAWERCAHSERGSAPLSCRPHPPRPHAHSRRKDSLADPPPFCFRLRAQAQGCRQDDVHRKRCRT
jgi:hypothetical protein